MTWVIVIAHLIFWAGVLWRAFGPFPAPASGGQVSHSPVRIPSPPRARIALGIHGAALAAFYGCVIHDLSTGLMENAVTVRGLLAAVLLAAAAVLMNWSVRVLHSWRLAPTVDPGHELCTSGPYAAVRHPIYLSIDLLAVSTAVWMPTPLVFGGAVLLVLGGELRARIEEAVLIEAFGDRYRSYMRRVKRLIPAVY